MASLVPLLDKLFRIYELQELKEYQTVAILIPWERMEKRKEIVSIFHRLYSERTIVGYSVRH